MFVVVVAIIISPWVASNQTLREGKLNTRIENNENVPHFVLKNRKRFDYMLDRDGYHAEFRA